MYEYTFIYAIALDAAYVRCTGRQRKSVFDFAQALLLLQSIACINWSMIAQSDSCTLTLFHYFFVVIDVVVVVVPHENRSSVCSNIWFCLCLHSWFARQQICYIKIFCVTKLIVVDRHSNVLICSKRFCRMLCALGADIRDLEYTLYTHSTHRKKKYVSITCRRLYLTKHFKP